MPFPWSFAQSLGARLLALMLALVLGTAGGIAFLATRSLHREVESLAGEHQAQLLDLLTLEIEQRLQSRIALLDGVARQVPDPRTATAADVRAVLARSTSIPVAFNAGALVTDASGTVVAEFPDRGRVGRNYRQEAGQPLYYGRPAVVHASGGKDGAVPVVGLSVPVRDAADRIVGALVGEVDLTQADFIDETGGVELGRHSTLLVIAPRSRLVLVDVRSRRLMQPLPPANAAGVLDPLLRGARVAVGAGLDGVESIATARTVPTAGWLAVIVTPTSQAFDAAHGLTRQVWVVAVVAAALGGLLVWWVLQQQLRPVVRAAEALDAAPKDEWPGPLPVARDDELGRLIARFNTLLEGLAAREAALRQANAVLSTVLDSVPVRVFWKDRDGRYLGANAAFARDAGVCAPSALVGMVDQDLPWRASAERYGADDRRVVQTGLPLIDFEEPFVGADGAARTLLTSKVPLVAERGQVIGVLGVFADITERKTDELQLRKLSLALEQSQECVLITDLQGRIEYVNEAFVRVSGYARAQVIGDNPNILKSGKTPADAYRSLWSAIGAGQPWAGTFVNRRRDGAEYLARTRVTPLRGADGQVTHYVGVVEDVTERERTAAELARHREHLEELVAQRTEALRAANATVAATLAAMDHLEIGVTWVDFDSGRCTLVNRPAAEALGYTVEEVLARPAWEAFVDGDEARFRRLAEVVRRSGSRRFEAVQRHKSGELTPFEFAVYYDEPRDGGPARLIALRMDISLRKASEAALLRAKESAEAASRAKSAFLANMSHEIRTPMNAIIGLSHVLRRSGLTLEQRHHLARIDASARHLLTIIDDILDLARIEGGRMELAEADFVLPALVQDVVAAVREAAEGKGLRLEIELEDTPAAAHGDAQRLRQALLNFVSNAVKFTDAGEVRVAVSVQERRGPALLLRFEVRDTGPGIADDRMGQLFVEFEQGDSSSTRRHGGTGLGLAITRRLAELMGGQVGVSSEPGRGSTFWFTAVVRAAGDEPSTAAGEPSTAAGDPAPEAIDAWAQLQRLRAEVLVVEDNTINREVVALLLSDTGLKVTTAVDGAEAVRMAREHRYDLVLMDVQMPEMDGLQATMALRALEGWDRVPIVALTANSFDEDRRACLDAGMNDFLAKPVEAGRLHATVLKWLARRATAPQTGPAGAAAVADGAAVAAAPPPRLEVDAVLECLGRLPGVDLARGIAAVLGQRNRYVDIVLRFAQVHAAMLGRLEVALAAGDMPDARFAAHTMRGAAWVLGLDALAQELQQLERALAPGADASAAAVRGELVSMIRERFDRIGYALRCAGPDAAGGDRGDAARPSARSG